jgi:hypothetical protein
MNIGKQFKNLKTGAKRVFVGMLVLSLISTATGIGSVFVYADQHDHIYGVTASSNGDGTHTYYCEVDGCDEEKTESCSFDDSGMCPVCGYHEPVEELDEEPEIQDSEHDHEYGDWLYNGDETHYRECSCGDRITEPCTFDSYISNYNATHLKRCSTCGNGVDEDCTFGEPVVSEDGTTVTVTCTLCGYSETTAYDGEPAAEEIGDDYEVLDNQTPSSEGKVDFLDFFSIAPVPAVGLEYNGKEQNLMFSMGTFRTEAELANIGVTEFNTAGFEPQTATDAGTYEIVCTFNYKYKDEEGKETTESTTGKYTVTISKAVFADVVKVAPDESNYIRFKNPHPFFSVEYNSILLTADTDYSVKTEGDSLDDQGSDVPEVGASCTYTFKSLNTTNFNDSTISKTVSVADVELKYNGSRTHKALYQDKLVIEAPSGYSISKTVDGTYGSSIEFTESQGSDFYVYLKFDSTGRKLKKSVSAFEIGVDFFKTYPEFHDEVTLTGDSVDLMSKAPVMNTDYITEMGYKDVSYVFTNTSDSSDEVKGQSPKATKKGVYTYKLGVLIRKSLNSAPEYVDTGMEYTTRVLTNLNQKNITFKAEAEDYQSLDSTKNLLDFYTVKDSDDFLQRDTHYTVTASPESDVYETGKEITLNYAAITDDTHLYTGTAVKTVKVSEITVLFNGKAQKEKYDDAVKMTASGYTISDSVDGYFNTEFEYSTPCKNQTITLYFKKDGTSRVVKQDIKGLTIGDAAEVKVLYDGSEDMKPYYFDTVRISAKNFKVSDSQKGPFNGSYVVRYEEGKEMNPVPDFDLYFQDTKTGVIYKKTISGLNLFVEPEIDILYNGEELVDWYNDDVEITAEGYTIDDEEEQGFTESYTMTGTGTISKKLKFKDEDGNVVEYMIVVSIDRTAPTGSVKLASYSSGKFISKDSDMGYVNSTKDGTVSASDDLSGVDFIRYYVTDTFYASATDVIAAVTEKSGMWRVYSNTSKPTVVKDKDNYIYVLIYDKAGNRGAISLGNIICDSTPPKATTIKVAPGTEEGSSTVGVAGKDSLSGVNRFKLIYREKTEGKNTPPSKQEVFDNGEYISVASETDGIAVGSLTIKDIDPEKTYLFYLVAVDRADNISEVITQEVEGKSAVNSGQSSQSPAAGAGGAGAGGSGAGGSGGSGSSGLAPAPSGIAGSGTPEKKDSQGSDNKGNAGTKDTSGKTGSGTDGQSTDKPINRDPYIADATGNTKIGEIETKGWDKISNEVSKADKGGKIDVEMSGMSYVSQQLFNSMKDKDVQVNLKMPNQVQWQIQGANVNSGVGDRDMGVKIGSRNIPAQVLSDVTGSYPHVEFSGTQPGDLGFEATIAIPVGDTNTGMTATLYSYDPDTKELVVAGTATVDEHGYAQFPMTSTGDCTVVITPEGVLSPGEATAINAGILPAEEEADTALYNDTSSLRLSDIFTLRGSSRAWLFVVAILSAGICVLILLLPSLQLQNRDEMGDDF